MHSRETPASHSFLAGGGRLGELIAAFDWSRTPLGQLQDWRAHLKTATGLMLRSQVPMAMLWDESGVMVYNDAYAAFSGSRHPGVLGANVREAWDEAADFNDHVMRVGLAGGTLSYRDQEFTLQRNGRAEQLWLNLDYSPLADESGTPVGVMAVLLETTDKVLAQRGLLGERERLARLFEQAPGFMAMLQGPEHRFVLANPSYQRVVGHRPVLGRTVAEALPDAASQGYGQLLDAVYRSGEAYTAHGAKFEVQAEPGGPVIDRYVDFVYQPIRAASGEVTGIFVEGVDVTGRVTAEQRREALASLGDALRELDDPAAVGFAGAELLGRWLKVSRVGYASIDDEAETLHVERDWTAPGIESLAGVLRLRDYGSFIDSLKRNEFIAIADVREDARTAAAAPALEARSARSFVNVPVVEQGRLVAVLYVNHAAARAWTDEDTAFVREVAHRTRMAVERVRGEAARQAEARARRAAQEQVNALGQRFRALVTASADVIFQMNPDWTQMRFLRGGDFVAEAGARSSHWFERHIPEDERPRVRAAIDEALRTKGVFELEHRVIRADGQTGWAVTRAIPVFDEHCAIVEWFGAAGDVTRRKQVEQALQDSEERLREAHRRKDEFLATLAHELRNPLAPIRNSVHLLSLAGQGQQIDKVKAILDRQVSHMVRLVDDLLEVARISRGRIDLQRELVRLSQVLDAAVEASGPGVEKAGHRLKVVPALEPVWVHADPVRLTQVFVNLLNNAVRYTRPGGEIELSVAREGEEVAVTVADNGIGIAAEHLPQLFDMFSKIDSPLSRSQGGLGIGLSLAQRLVQMHGGSLHAASEGPGRGSRFTARLPCVRDPRLAEPAPHDEAAPASTRRVLVVDDNRDAADSTGLLLSMLGCEVRVVYDGGQALALVPQWQPEVVLLDLGMPGMDGHEVAQRLRALRSPGAPMLVALTGWGQEEDRERTRHAGFDQHLVKPVDVEALRRLMASARG